MKLMRYVYLAKYFFALHREFYSYRYNETLAHHYGTSNCRIQFDMKKMIHGYFHLLSFVAIVTVVN